MGRQLMQQATAAEMYTLEQVHSWATRASRGQPVCLKRVQHDAQPALSSGALMGSWRCHLQLSRVLHKLPFWLLLTALGLVAPATQGQARLSDVCSTWAERVQEANATLRELVCRRFRWVPASACVRQVTFCPCQGFAAVSAQD